jgi:archaea-specific DNA-binding protein
MDTANDMPIAGTTPAASTPIASAQTATSAPLARAERADMNVIYIGKKSVMGYVLAVVTQFNGGAQEVFIKARGKTISRAVDVAEIVRHRFLPEVKIGNILTKTEEMDSEDGSKTKVSAIEIRLNR